MQKHTVYMYITKLFSIKPLDVYEKKNHNALIQISWYKLFPVYTVQYS